MNAMRVWGGGRYENEEFYEMADRKVSISSIESSLGFFALSLVND